MATYSALDGPSATPMSGIDGGIGSAVPPSTQSVGLIPVLSNSEIDEMVESEKASREPVAPVLSGLAAHVRKC